MRQSPSAVACIFAYQHNVMAAVHHSKEIMFNPNDTGMVVPSCAKPVILAGSADQLNFQRCVVPKVLNVESGLGDAAVIRFQRPIRLWQEPWRQPNATKPADAKVDITEISGPADGVGYVFALRSAGIASLLCDWKRWTFAACQTGIDIFCEINC